MMKIKNFITRNLVTLIFTVMVVFALFKSSEMPFVILNTIVQNFSQYSFLVLALIIPVMAGMGFNFGIAIGAIAGQIGIIMAINWGFSGFTGFIFTVTFATIFAIIFGILSGMVLNKARGNEMFTSLIIGYLGNGIYQFIFISLIGAVIPFAASDLLLSSGTGLRNTIDLRDTFLYPSDGLLQIPFFLLLIIVGVFFLILNIYRLKKDDVALDKPKVFTKILLATITIIISIVMMYTDILPNEIRVLKNVNFPVITGVLICAAVAFNLLITRTKAGQKFTTVSMNQQNSNESVMNVSRVRITAIVISTVLASWGQIINLQNTGILLTYSSHRGIAFTSVLCLIVGGATIKRATVKQALLGILLVQSYLIIALPVFDDLITPSMSGVISSIIMYSVLLYAFTRSNSNKKINIDY